MHTETGGGHSSIKAKMTLSLSTTQHVGEPFRIVAKNQTNNGLAAVGQITTILKVSWYIALLPLYKR